MSTDPTVIGSAPAETDQETEHAPALWNPVAAAAWSLLLSPAFGAYLHMRNWQALGEPRKAASAKRWVVVVICVVGFCAVFGAFLPANASSFAGIGLFVVWYIGSAHSQATYVKARHGSSYPRKSWAKSLAFGVVAVIAFSAVVVVIHSTIKFALRTLT